MAFKMLGSESQLMGRVGGGGKHRLLESVCTPATPVMPQWGWEKGNQAGEARDLGRGELTQDLVPAAVRRVGFQAQDGKLASDRMWNNRPLGCREGTREQLEAG